MNARRLLLAALASMTVVATGAPAPAQHGPASPSRASAPTPTSVALGQTGLGVTCGDKYTGVQTSVGGAPAYTTPSAGVITSFAYQADGDPGQIRALFFVPASPTSYQVVAKSPLHGIVLNSLNTFSTRLPVPAGAVLGSQMSSANMVCGAGGAVPGDSFAFGTFDPDSSSTFTPAFLGFNGRWNTSAVLESDADGDGFGDVTQDLCPESKLTQVPCPAPDTTVTRAPAKTSTRRKATIKFVPTIPGSTFTCAVDKKAAKPCTSPFRKQYKAGKHKVVITATSAFGIVDTTPVTVRFKITKPRR